MERKMGLSKTEKCIKVLLKLDHCQQIFSKDLTAASSHILIHCPINMYHMKIQDTVP